MLHHYLYNNDCPQFATDCRQRGRTWRCCVPSLIVVTCDHRENLCRDNDCWADVTIWRFFSTSLQSVCSRADSLRYRCREFQLSMACISMFDCSVTWKCNLYVIHNRKRIFMIMHIINTQNLQLCLAFFWERERSDCYLITICKELCIVYKILEALQLLNCRKLLNY